VSSGPAPRRRRADTCGGRPGERTPAPPRQPRRACQMTRQPGRRRANRRIHHERSSYTPPSPWEQTGGVSARRRRRPTAVRSLRPWLLPCSWPLAPVGAGSGCGPQAWCNRTRRMRVRAPKADGPSVEALASIRWRLQCRRPLAGDFEGVTSGDQATSSPFPHTDQRVRRARRRRWFAERIRKILTKARGQHFQRLGSAAPRPSDVERGDGADVYW